MKNLEKRITKLKKENLLLQEKVDFLTKKLYGSTTEQTSSLLLEGQISLFDEAETSADMEKSPMPYPVIQHSYASPGAVVWIIHQK